MYVFHRSVISVLFVASFAVGLWRFEEPEIFPFAAWDMYARTPSTVVDFRFRVHRLREHTFDPPRLLREIPELRERAESITHLTAMRKFGGAVLADDPESEIYREKAERLFGLRDAEYELLHVVYDPMEKYLHDKHQQTVLKRYSHSVAANAPVDESS